MNLLKGLGGVAGFGENTMIGMDDSSSGEIDITSIFGPDGMNFYGTTYTSLWINDNGSVTFTGPSGTFTPNVLTENSSNPVITPFFADVDTSSGASAPSPGGNSTGSNAIYYDLDTENDRIVITWDDVGYFYNHDNWTNSFQLILSEYQYDDGDGDFNIEFRYENIDWTTGDASGGSDGLGGLPARAGYTAANGNPNDYYELAASGNGAALLALESSEGNYGRVGVWEFHIRDGYYVDANMPTFPTNGESAWSSGLAHLSTFDGVTYDFQAAGEFVLLRSTTTTDLEVQTRLAPLGNGAIVNQAISIKAENGQSVTIDTQADMLVAIDGESVTVTNFSYISIGNDRLYRLDDTYTYIFAGSDDEVNDGDGRIIINIHENRVDLDIRLTNEFAGQLEGLLGNANGDTTDDVSLDDGTPLSRPLDFGDLYGAFHDDWRVADENDSLFTYADGLSTEDYFLPGYPGSVVSYGDFSEDDIAFAQNLAINAGIAPDSANYNIAVLDFLVTGDISIINAAAKTSSSAITFSLPLPVPINLEILGDSGNNVLTGGMGHDYIAGFAGNDDINGGIGFDFIIDGLGHDTLNGGGGNDVIISFGGIGQLEGGGSSDYLLGGFQADTLDGGSANDVLRGDPNASVFGGSDILTGGVGDDFLMGGDGADVFVFNPYDGDDTIAEFEIDELNYHDTTGFTASAIAADFQVGVDDIHLVGFSSVHSGNVMSYIHNDSTGAVFEAQGTAILFYGITSNDLSNDDFSFG